jgi:hypothetical protein
LGDAQQGSDLWDAVGVGAEFDEFLADFGRVHGQLRVNG